MKIIKRIVRILFVLTFALYIGGILLINQFEDKLIFLNHYGSVDYYTPNDPTIEEIKIKADDGIELTGWKISATTPSQKWMLFFPGNASNIADTILGYPQRFKELSGLGYNVLVFDHRGYGINKGKPGEQAFYDDALTKYHYLTKGLNVAPENITLYGYSLGSGIAVYLATKKEIGGLILEGAYKSVPEVGESRFPLIPMNWMADQRFDSFSRMHKVKAPLLMFHSSDDTVIPYSHGQELFTAALMKDKTFVTLKGGHTQARIKSKEEYLEGLRGF